MWDVSHFVMPLTLHLPRGDSTITHTTGFGKPSTRRAPRSKLEAFFLLVADDTTARAYTYVQMPGLYRVLEDTRKWVKRKCTVTIQVGRIYPAPQSDTEKRATHLLLAYVLGLLGFLELQTFNKTVFVVLLPPRSPVAKTPLMTLMKLLYAKPRHSTG
ncbi:hypothetical protein CDIK_2917 [Cucumispora dikerogammari]|nr:hypothetical protein CDIK_2917 [Cucumispora dikerogammari]